MTHHRFSDVLLGEVTFVLGLQVHTPCNRKFELLFG